MEFKQIKKMLTLAVVFGFLSLSGTVASFIYMDYFKTPDTQNPVETQDVTSITDLLSQVEDRIPFQKHEQFKSYLIDQGFAETDGTLTKKFFDDDINRIISNFSQEGEDKPIPGVKVFKVYEGAFTDYLSAVGSIESASETELKFETSGTITDFNFRPGDFVKNGDVIAELDHNDADLKVRYRRAKRQSAKTALIQAKKKYDTHKGLYDLGVISKSKLDEIKLDLNTAKEEYNAANIELESAKAEQNKTYLICPKDGVLDEKFVEVGETVSQNTKIAIVIEIGTVFAKFGVIEKNMNLIALGLDVTAMVESSKETKFHGKIYALDPSIDKHTRMMTVTAKIENPEKILIPGAYANIAVTVFQTEKTMLIPKSCLIPKEPEGYQVYVVDSGNKAVIRDIAVEYDKNAEIAAISKGLKPEDLVVLGESQYGLEEGAEVEILEIQEGPLQ